MYILFEKVRSAILILAVLSTAGNLHAQQAPQTSLIMFNKYAFNPAYGGLDGSLSVTGAYRAQWIDLPGNPEQNYLNAHMPFYLWNGAIGMSIYSESIGAEKLLTGMLSYNYVLETDFGLFSAGIASGLSQRTLRGDLLRTPGGDYEGSTVNHNDPILPITSERNVQPVLQLGAYYAGTSFEGGISLTQLEIGSGTLADGFNYASRSAVQLFGEYYIETLDWLRIYPTLWVKTDFAQTQAEITARAVYDNLFQFGLGMRGSAERISEGLVIFLGARIAPQFSIAYAYDIDISPLRQNTDGTHEIVLRYTLDRVIGAGLPPRVIYNPRML